MAERPPQASTPWQIAVAVDGLPEEGRHFDLVAEPDTRTAIAKVVGLHELPRLEAHFHVARHGSGSLRVVGQVLATVGQTCVVTLDPLISEIAEDVELVFVPVIETDAQGETNGTERGPKTLEKSDQPQPGWNDETEPLVDGTIDLGAVAIEFLLLGIDPYPRKPGAEFEPPQDVSPDEGPFAALAELKKNSDAR